MTDNPCKKEYDEFKKAIEEWVAASNVDRLPTSLEPIGSDKEFPLIPEEAVERSIRARELEVEALKRVRETNKAYQECKQKYS